MSWPHPVGSQQEEKRQIAGNTPTTPAVTRGRGGEHRPSLPPAPRINLGATSIHPRTLHFQGSLSGAVLPGRGI